MRKEATVLATVCVMIIIVVFFEFYLFRVSVKQGTIPVSEIMAYPSDWVGRTVIVEGNLSKSTTFAAFFFNSSWSYRLSSGGESIEVNASANSFDWNFDPNSTAPVAVYGVVERLSDTINASGGSPMATVYYYITADKIDLVLSQALCGCPDRGP